MENDAPSGIGNEAPPAAENEAPPAVENKAPQVEKKVGHKRIIICCDGTWQSATSGKENVPSNVTRLIHCLNRTWTDEHGNECPQIIWYDSGIGTTSSWIGQKIEGAFGNGLEVKVIEAYQFCVMNYSPGDKILCFGFSRGAYTARSIAGLISDVGICPRDNLQTFHELWEFYKQKGSKKKNDEEKFFKDSDWIDFVWGREADLADQIPREQIKDVWADPIVWDAKPHPGWEDNEGHSWPREVEVVGVYDTVGALGFPAIFGYQLPFGPDKNGFHNVQLSPHIKHAFQALALDEHRVSFSPTLWHLPLEQRKSSESELADAYANAMAGYKRWRKSRKDPNASRADRGLLDRKWRSDLSEVYKREDANLPLSELVQVWFPGCHVNIGGGSSSTLEKEGDLEALSNVAFAWMLDRIDPYVSINRFAYRNETDALYSGIRQLNINAETAAREAREQEAKTGRLARIGASILHPFTAAPSTKAKIYQLTWGLGDFSDSYTTLYMLNGSWRRTPGNYTSVANKDKPYLGRTNEFIHPSVGYRMDRLKADADDKKKYGPYQWKKGEFVRKLKDDDSGYEYIVADSTQPIDEWKLPALTQEDIDRGFDIPIFERFVVYTDDAKEYVDKLDTKYGHVPQRMGSIEETHRVYLTEEARLAAEGSGQFDSIRIW